jgi:hypothetical protein
MTVQRINYILNMKANNKNVSIKIKFSFVFLVSVLPEDFDTKTTFVRECQGLAGLL